MKEQKMNNFQNQEVEVFVTIERSENNQIMIGKLDIIPKKSIRIPPIQISIKGMYIVSQSSSKQQIIQSDYSEINFKTQNCVQNQIQSDTKRQDQMKTDINKKTNILRVSKCQEQLYQVFLYGKQVVGQQKNIQIRKKGRKIIYPFNFRIPPNLPSSITSVFFANKNIQIRYVIQVKTQIKKKKKEDIHQCHFKFNFTVYIPQTIERKKQTQLCTSLSYYCFTKYFCRCLGKYHIQFVATVLNSGNLQVQCRIFRQDNKAANLFKRVYGILFGQLKKSKKVVLGKKQFPLNRNQYEMLQGQVLFQYQPSLRSHKTNLFSINFWLEAQIQFQENIWKFKQKNDISDIIL